MNKETTLAYIKDIAMRLSEPDIYGGASLMVAPDFQRTQRR